MEGRVAVVGDGIGADADEIAPGLLEVWLTMVAPKALKGQGEARS